jgi:M3 family oligoendopeptidase
MKFSEYVYVRPDLASFKKEFESEINNLNNAGSVETALEALSKINKLRNKYETARTISQIRYTGNTRDPKNEEEHNFFDNAKPITEGLLTSFYKALINNKYRSELEKKLGSHLFNVADRIISTFTDDIVEDLRKENQLVTQYVKLMSSAEIDFKGQTYNIAGLSPLMMSTDRSLRKEATKAKWKFFEDNSEEFDRIFDELVKVRTQIARKLGFKNFIELGYARMRRTDYNHTHVADFREHIRKHLVPVVLELKEKQRKRLGLDKLYFYDNDIDFNTGNAAPKGNPEWIMERAGKMYSELSPETGKFMNYMMEGELTDLYNKAGKAPGGYCTFIAEYKSPFIFSNMNGTSDDIRVLTHEAGHAFQGFCSRDFDIPEYRTPTMEACEIHSMSMEFLTWDWMNLFFEEQTDKFKYAHLERALKFIPYGVSVDEFQHFVYENPDATPEERKKAWSAIEKKYLSFRDYDDIEFLKNGGFWQSQPHIYRLPFYYIDYCLAEICALQFWKKAVDNKKAAWEDYLALCKEGGKYNFTELIKIAKIKSPFEETTVKTAIEHPYKWLSSINDDALER